MVSTLVVFFLSLTTLSSAFMGSLPISLRCVQRTDLQMSCVDRRDVIRAGVALTLSTIITPLVARADGASDWMEVEDPSTGKTYWYNTKTQKTSFEKPDGSSASAAAAAAPAAQSGTEAPKLSRMGGLLDNYRDISKGFSLLRPVGWNQFDSAPGDYDVKWEDIVEKSELVMVGSSTVKSASSISALGTIDKVGAALAAKKKAELVEAKDRTTDGIQYYTFLFKAGEGKNAYRELYELCINKGKLWSLTATTSEKRWAKRQELFLNIALSFQPRL